MSSHHIVRENQEPALLIASAQAISYEKIQELLEWMPTVVVLSDEVDTVISWGIKVDVVIAPLDELPGWRDRLADQAPVKLVSYNQGEDPLTTAIYFLTATKANAVNCLLKDKHDLDKMQTLSALDTEAFVENKIWSCIRSGHYEKWLPAGATLYLLPEALQVEVPEFKTGSYPVIQDGIVSIKSNHVFWIGEELM